MDGDVILVGLAIALFFLGLAEHGRKKRRDKDLAESWERERTRSMRFFGTEE